MEKKIKLEVYHPDMEELEKKIIAWAYDRDIFKKATPFTQWFKTKEELLELYVAINDKDSNGVKDAVGDVIVTLIVQAKMWDLNIQECLEHAYNEIKDRKGTMINGMFVKDVG